MVPALWEYISCGATTSTKLFPETAASFPFIRTRICWPVSRWLSTPSARILTTDSAPWARITLHSSDTCCSDQYVPHGKFRSIRRALGVQLHRQSWHAQATCDRTLPGSGNSMVTRYFVSCFPVPAQHPANISATNNTDCALFMMQLAETLEPGLSAAKCPTKRVLSDLCRKI